MIKRLAVLDWGIGGLSVLKALQNRHPRLDFVYLSDSGFTPYGKLSVAELRDRLTKLFAWAQLEFGADAFLIACNAASTAFMGQTQLLGTPLYNVIEPTLMSLRQGASRRLAVIGGVRTIESRVYSSGLGSDFHVQEIVAQPLSAMIERGQIRGVALTDYLAELLSPVKKAGAEALVLACTHYPAVAEQIRTLIPEVALIDPAQILAQSGFDICQTGMGHQHFLTTGDRAQTKEAAHLAFGYQIEHVERLQMDFAKDKTFSPHPA